MFSLGAGVDDGGTDGILEISWCNIYRVHVDRCYAYLFWIVSSLGSVVGYSFGDRGRG